ncbi:hypothetical protein [Pseudomonas phoenicis]|uniref:hypothetical protein n=1 Tax=unclassified Pseudomonas TaxID=196821 RepID=UPI0039A16684
MPTPRQLSFLATLSLNAHPVQTLESLHGAPVWINRLGGAGVLPGLVSTVRNDSHLLGCRANEQVAPLLFYCRHTPSGYHLYVREPGKHFGKGIKRIDGAYLGLGCVHEPNPQPITLETPGGQNVDLRDLPHDTHPVSLKAGDRPIALGRRNHSPHTYLTLSAGAPLLWTLKIVARNVPWVSQPDEA